MRKELEMENREGILQIVDLDANVISITDLNLALMQADDFRRYETNDPEQTAFFCKRQVYWEDFYQKLLALSINMDEERL
jgi:hypothetical protein